MATSTVNLGALLGLEGELRRQLEDSFSISGEKNNVSNQKKSANGYRSLYNEDSNQLQSVASYNSQNQLDRVDNYNNRIQINREKVYDSKNQLDKMNGYDKQHKDDEENNRGILEEFEGQYVLEEESGPKKHTKKKLVKKKKTHSELEAPPLPETQEKKLPTLSEQMPTSSLSRPNKQQLREAILWAEVLGEPKYKKRHRR